MVFKSTWRGTQEQMESLSVFFTEIDGASETAVSLTRPADETIADPDAAWLLEAYSAESPDVQSLKDRLQAHDARLAGLEPLEIAELPAIDWVAHALEGLGIVRAGRFVLHGVHDAARLPKGDDLIPIRIDANQAFGTGHHPTTAGCLELLDRLAGFRPRSIFDLGCGSAVLSIAAAKLWDRDVLASDIDERSVEIAQENARLNDVGERVSVVCADGFDHMAIFEGSPFDFVFANILAGPLIEFAPLMEAHVARSGRVMLAGLMANQEQAVTAAYEAAGFRRINRLAHDVWPVLLFARP